MSSLSCFAVVLLSIALVACDAAGGGPSGDGSENIGSAGMVSSPQSNSGGSVEPSGVVDSGDCTYILDADITSPTRLINTSNYCDYQLADWVEVRSLLEIEPGTVIRSGPDERLLVEGGELRAIGTAQERIVFEGLSPVQGFWRGIDVDYARNVVMDYVDIRDAGQVCSSSFCPDVAVMISNTTFSFTNSSVSNSYVHGMTIEDDTRIDAFYNNRFFGNALNGLNMDIEIMPALDSASDYYGLEAPNGIVGVGVISGEQFSGGAFQWKALNAPYLISGYLDIQGGLLQLDPGVELVFAEEAWMTVEGNGMLRSMGTATDPVIIRGSKARAGHWNGIRMSYSNHDRNLLQHTIVSHSGNTAGLIAAYAGLRLDEAFVTLRSSSFVDNDRWGIYCTEPDDLTEASIIVDGGGNRFSNNGSGNLPSNCSIQY